MFVEVAGRLGSSVAAVLVVLVSITVAYAAIVVCTRVAGARSLAQMSAFDFVATVALGSMLASIGMGSVPLVEGLVAVVTLFVLQFAVGRVRRTRVLSGAIDNRPLLLVRDGEVLEDHMRAARLTSADLRSHLRQADVTDLASVRAVVLETTGDVSVLQGEGDIGALLQGVRGAEGHPGPRGQLRPR